MTSAKCQITHEGHSHDVLAADFDKYNSNILTTTSADRTVKTWDVRNLIYPLHILVEQKYGSRRIKYSPFKSGLFATVGYGMNCSLWLNQNLLFSKQYKEFTMGVDFSLSDPNLLAVCGWDQTVDFINISAINK